MYAQTKGARNCPISNGDKPSGGDPRQRNIRVTYLVSYDNRRMDDRNSKAWEENEHVNQIEEQVWDYLLDNFYKYILWDILGWCHVFCAEKEKKRMVLDKLIAKYLLG